MNIQKILIENQIRDIRQIRFGESRQEILSILNVIHTMKENASDEVLLHECEIKLQEGVNILQKMGDWEAADTFLSDSHS